MALQLRTVIVKQLPQTSNEEQTWAFLETFKMDLPADRPRIVLNCGSIPTFDRSSLHLLLCCLEEAMKRNGDVRLSSLSEPARTALEVSGIDELFKTFNNDAEAIKSFQRLPLLSVVDQSAPSVSLCAEVLEDMPVEETENAA